MLVNHQETAICFVADKAYLPHFAACLYSFLDYQPTTHHFYLISDDVEEGDVAEIRTYLHAHNAHSLTLVKVDKRDFETFDGFWEQHGLQVFYRIVIPEYLPVQFKYMLYLDVDMVFNGQLEFESFANQPSPIAAVRDTISDILAPKRGLTRYLNSGVLLVDLNFWRENETSKALFYVVPPLKRFADQDILNEHFKDNWFELPAAYNYPASRLKLSLKGLTMSNGQVPAIIHFNGGIKPWKYWQRGSFIYWRYIWKTPYKSLIFGAPKTMLNSMMHFLKKRL